ncbi:MAG: hypothetical protein U1E33_01745 [Rhodospirillales bacterium]
MRIGITGCAGRMGRLLLRAVLATSGASSPAASSGQAIRRWARISGTLAGAHGRSASRPAPMQRRCSPPRT